MYPGRVSFQLAALTKTRTATKSMEFFFPSFPHNKRLCPVTCLDSNVKELQPGKYLEMGPTFIFNHSNPPQSCVFCYLWEVVKRHNERGGYWRWHLQSSFNSRGSQLSCQGQRCLSEVSLSRISYKQLIGQGKQHSIVSTTTPNILILLAKQSLMVRASFKRTN